MLFIIVKALQKIAPSRGHELKLAVIIAVWFTFAIAPSRGHELKLS